jgi:hypothetical protein
MPWYVVPSWVYEAHSAFAPPPVLPPVVQFCVHAPLTLLLLLSVVAGLILMSPLEHAARPSTPEMTTSRE